MADRLTANMIWSGYAAASNDVFLPYYNVASELAQIRVPTLILVGRDDFICPVSQAERMHQGIPNSEVVVFEHSGHFPWAEEPGAFLDTVRGWLGRHRR